MKISLYQASVPVFVRALHNLSEVLKKGAGHALDKGVNPDRLLDQRLIFDMLPLVKQVQIACDTAARSTARMAGVEPKAFPDDETTLAEARQRIDAAIAYLETFKPEQLDGREETEVVHKTRGSEKRLPGIEYLRQYALPNFFFHCATAYAIVRVAGTPVGKLDYLGWR